MARASMLVIALLLFIPRPARTEDVGVSVDTMQGDCGVRGVFIAPVPASIAWDVLTDYDRLSGFVKSMHSSRLERGEDGRKLLRQDAVANVFMVHRHMLVLLELREDPGNWIAFRDVLGKDFRSYVGQWRLSAASDQTRVEYELVAEPRAAVARALCRGMLHNTARELLEEVREEMMRRAAEAR